MSTAPGANPVSSTHSTNNLKQALAGMHFHFPAFKHEQHEKIINVNEVVAEKYTLGQRVADSVASGMGSWTFIIAQAGILTVWIIYNSVTGLKHFDEYPYILLNLVLSFQAGFAAPVIMMSQNRQAEKDRLTAQNDYATDVKGEQEICHIMDHLDHQDTLILQVVQRLETQHIAMAQQEKVTLSMLQQIQEQNRRIELQQKQLAWLKHAHPDVAQEMEAEIDGTADVTELPIDKVNSSTEHQSGE